MLQARYWKHIRLRVVGRPLTDYVNIDHLPDYNCMVYGMYIRYGDAKGKGPTQYLPHLFMIC